jgi:hypothetical protein
MLIALADENAGAEASLREQIDTVSTAQKFLKEHSVSCKVSHRGTASKTGEQHEHGSLNCIVAFLGDANWSRSKVGRILEAANKLDPFVVSKVAPVGTTHPSRNQMLSTKAALAIGEIPDSAVSSMRAPASLARRLSLLIFKRPRPSPNAGFQRPRSPLEVLSRGNPPQWHE